MRLKIWLLAIFLLINLIFVLGQQCQEGETRVCTGLNEGICDPGIQICESGQWSICYGAIGPSNEVCNDGQDNDCDGLTDEDCECTSGQTRQCGPGTNQGICEFGIQNCVNNQWKSCQGAVLPYPADLCGQSGLGNSFDDDCDGQTDEGCGGQINQSAGANCFNKIKDANEEGVDCGGLCVKCATCFDRIQNQNETNIDCGGPCLACPSCNDRIKNQGETEVDCGGPCKKCEEIIEKDSDNDGIIDSLDELPFCPNDVCDKSRGENRKNCPQDCRESKTGVILLILFLIVILIFFFYLYFRYKKGSKGVRNKEEKQLIKPIVNIQKVKEMEKKAGKEFKYKAEEELEKSIKKVEKFIK